MSHQRRIAVTLRVDEPFPNHQDVLSGVFDYAREHPEWHCVVDEHPTYAAVRRGEQARPYDGVIARGTPALQRRLATLGIPLVNVWYQHARPTVPGVYPDIGAIGRAVADHLIDRGFGTLAFIGAKKHRLDEELGRAFADAAAERRCPCVIDDCGDPNFGDLNEWLALRRRLEDLLDTLSRPVGMFVTMASVARLIMTICHTREHRGARGVGVVCFGNVKTVVELPPQITTIDSNLFRVGQAAAELLDQLMAGVTSTTTVQLIPPKGMVPRESTDFFAVEDDVVAATLEYIAGRLRKPLSVDEIAKAIATSPRSLQRRFEAVMGCGVSDAIRRLRIDLAKRLLGDNKLTVDRIASEAGFSSSVTLNHVFRREVGMSPTAYRKQIQGG